MPRTPDDEQPAGAAVDEPQPRDIALEQPTAEMIEQLERESDDPPPEQTR